MSNPAKISKNSRYYQSYYTVKNPEKYLGDLRECVARSSWERSLMKNFDMNPAVVKWCAEPFAIPYISPKDGKTHRYYPDFIVVARHPRTGVDITTLIEVKPYAQTQPPKTGKGRAKSRIITETMTYHINQAKWDAAKAICQQKGWKFRIMTEHEIKPKYPSQG